MLTPFPTGPSHCIEIRVMTIELIKIINLVKNKTTRALKSLTLASSLGAINILMFFGIVVLLSGCGKNFSPSKDFKMAIQNKSKNTKDSNEDTNSIKNEKLK